MITNNRTGFDALKLPPNNWEHFLCILFVFIFPLSFMSVKHGVHVSLYGIFILYIYSLIKATKIIFFDKKLIFIFMSLSSLLITTALQQITTINFNFSAWDGPSRLLIAGIALLYLHQKNINYVKILEIAIPTGLILLVIYLSFHQKYYWGHRWANVFVDPNSLGSQSTILSMVCLLSIQPKAKSYLTILKVIGAIAGLYISVKAESRGGWIAIPFMIVIWLILKLRKSNQSSSKETIKTIAIFLFFLICITTLAIFIDPIKNRFMATIIEIKTWFRDPTIYTSAGARMSMWVAAIQLIQENPIGYGEIAIKDVLKNHSLHSSIYMNGVKDMLIAGPHSDILSKGLSLGILGIVAYLATIFSPVVLFASKVKSRNISTHNAAHMGLIYVTGVFIVGLFNENLSLKYLCSFYGLMIACLTADVLRDNSSTCNTNQSSA